MGSAAQKKELVLRNNLHRTLSNHKDLVWSYHLTLSLSAMSGVAIGIIFPILNMLNHDFEGAAYGVGKGAVMALLLWAVARFSIRPLAHTTVTVSPTQFIIKILDKTSFVALKDITKVTLRYLPYLGGHLKLHTSDGQVYKITLKLERCDYIIETLASFNSDLIEAKSLETFRRTAIVCDHSWSRLYKKLLDKKSLVIKFIMAPLLITSCTAILDKGSIMGVSPNGHLGSFLIFFEINLLIGWGVWAISELVFMIKTRDVLLANPNHAVYNSEFDKILNINSTWVHLLLLIGAAFL